MNKLKRFLYKCVKQILNSIKRFPISGITSLCIVILGISMVHIEVSNDWERITQHIMMTLMLLLPLSAAIHLLLEKYTNKTPVSYSKIISFIIMFIFGFVYYLIIPDSINPSFLFRYFTLLIIFYTVFTIIPYWYNKKNYEIYVLILVNKFFLTIFYAVVLYFGLSSILFTINALFELHLSEDLYFDLFIIVSGLFTVFYFLGNVPEQSFAPELKDYPKVFKKLFLSIVIPLLIAYTTILYAYFVRILVRFSLPKGMIGNLVIWYAIISIIVLFFINSLENVSKLTKKFINYYPYAMILPLFLMFFSIGIRINDVGITLSRYMVVLGGIFSFIIIIYFLFSKKRCSTYIIATGIVTLLFASYIPIVNGVNISKWSQNSRFENLLKNLNMLTNDGKIVARKDLSNKDKQELINLLNYFDEYYKLGDIKLLEKDFAIKDVEKTFGFKYIYYDRLSSDRINIFLKELFPIYNISDYDYFMDFDAYPDKNSYNLNPFNIKLDKDMMLKITYKNKQNITIDMNDVSSKMLKYNFNKDDNLTINDTTFEFENNELKVKLIIISLEGEKIDDKLNNLNINMKIAVKIK